MKKMQEENEEGVEEMKESCENTERSKTKVVTSSRV